ncbi:MAG: hypothetical protein ACD_35C00004G0007 [uncultured bacterium]|nr:MAG: hypothetical protein ACD_35C00004G0007 [uncultured bacterium]
MSTTMPSFKKTLNAKPVELRYEASPVEGED